MDRKLDGVFFRVQRNNKWESVCISDMSDEERAEVLKDKDAVFLRRLVDILAMTIHDIGEQLDLKRE
jgi:hypothetical protein